MLKMPEFLNFMIWVMFGIILLMMCKFYLLNILYSNRKDKHVVIFFIMTLIIAATVFLRHTILIFWDWNKDDAMTHIFESILKICQIMVVVESMICGVASFILLRRKLCQKGSS